MTKRKDMFLLVALFAISLDLKAQKKKEEDAVNIQQFRANFSFTSTINEEVPKLKMTFDAQTPGNISLIFMENPICFMQNYFDIEFVESPIPKPILKKCKLDPAKAKGTSISKNEKSIEFVFSELFESSTKWKFGRYSILLNWIKDPMPSSSSLVNSTWVLAQPLQTFQIKKGEQIQLLDGAIFKFVGHSHKRTFPDQASPLMVYGQFKKPDEIVFKEISFNLYPPRVVEMQFAENFHAKLIDHDYNISMKITYYGLPTNK
ncbi:MAG: hypothetical protein ACK5V3_15745 [Bdellovibrionales bacterium]